MTGSGDDPRKRTDNFALSRNNNLKLAYDIADINHSQIILKDTKLILIQNHKCRIQSAI